MQLDATCRLSATALIVGIITLVLLVDDGGWLVLAAVPFFLSWVGYKAAISAAVAYGEMLSVAFDLHRFDVLKALHLSLPTDAVTEADINKQLSLFWMQDVPLMDVQYVHDRSESESDD
ncbi:hypothetical protein [Arthrobacter oryzae]|uniref:hypothetical protein n=1 Tax=Arthrobacter oryzae TaxID=409290 RepID=UPI002781D532|nr:hypothetical protein [Arthrobacter oryzae]MDQ0078528.1 hypothetical protein [Arthrobacter oryzae]